MFKHLKIAVKMALATLVLTGVAYPLAILAAAQAAFPWQSNGSLIRGPAGEVVGSPLIAQKFERPEYFHPRPSAVGCDAARSGGSNLGPTNGELRRLVAARVRNLSEKNGPAQGGVPIDAVTASASGLDPDITPANARYQAGRVARARRMPPDIVRDLVAAHTAPRQLRFLGGLGEPRVNVLTLNMALDDLAARGELP